MSTPDARLLKQVPLFAGLTAPQLVEVHLAGVRRKLRAGAPLFVEEAPATTLFVVLEGRVRVTRRATGGQVVVLHFGRPGDVLGCAILGGARAYPGTAEVVEDAVVLAFDERAIAGLVERHPLVARNALRLLSRRMEDLRVRLRELATERVDRRLASALTRLALPGPDQARPSELRLSRQDLAELVGTTQHTVSRILSAWERAGWVRLGRQRMEVRDLDALARVERGEVDGAA